MRASLGQWKEAIGLLRLNEAEPKNLLKTKEKQPGQWGASDAALNLLDTTMGTKHVQDLDVTGTLLAKSQFSFAIQQNPKAQGTEPLLPGKTPHLSLGLWFPVSAMVLEVEELLKTALVMRGGFELPHELSDPTRSHLGVTLALSAGRWEGSQKGQGQVRED